MTQMNGTRRPPQGAANGSREIAKTSTPSEIGSPKSSEAHKIEFAKSILAFCHLKRTAEFDKPQLKIWYTALEHVPIPILNYALLTISIQQKEFPDFGHVYTICRRRMIQTGLLTEKYSPSGNGDSSIGIEEIKSIGEALGLAVK